MTKEQNRSTGFYEAKGMTRQTVIMEQTTKESLKNLAKRFDLTQGEIIDVLVAHADIDAIESNGHFRLKLEAKTGAKPSKSKIVKQLKDVSPEKLAEIQKILQS